MEFTEAARRGIRAIAPEPVYRRCASAFGDLVAMLRMGARDYARLQHARRVHGGDTLLCKAPGIQHSVELRPGTSDVTVFENNLIRRSYACAQAQRPVRLIVDAGANAGYASVYFLNAYPEALVVALEPDPENAALARRNLAPYARRARLIEAAIWPRDAKLRIGAAQRRDSVQVEEARDGALFDCIGLDPLTVAAQVGMDRIDLFKCDIEGAERELFRHNPDAWLQKTGCIVIEIHGEEARKIVYAAAERHGFSARRHRDLHVFERPKRDGRGTW